LAYTNDRPDRLFKGGNLAKFKDKLDREWTIELVHPDIKGLRKSTGFDLNIAVGDPSALAVLDDPEKCLDILWYCCEKQAQAKSIVREQFEEGFDGPARSRGVEAFADAFTDFGYAPAVATILKEKQSGDVERRLENLRKTQFGSKNSDTNLPESPESIPAG
jgi:hypothetical protein